MNKKRKVAVLAVLGAMALGFGIVAPAAAAVKQSSYSVTTAYGICYNVLYIYWGTPSQDFAITALDTSQANACGFAYTREYYTPSSGSMQWSSWAYGSGDSYGWYSSKSGDYIIKSQHRLYQPGLPMTDKYLTANADYV